MRLSEAVNHFLLDCEVRGRTNTTLISYRYRLNDLVQLLEQLCEVTELEKVNVNHLRQCVQHLLTAKVTYSCGRRTEGDTLSPNTVRAHVRAFRAFFNWCYQEELIDSNPVTRLGTPKVPKRIVPTFTPEHIDTMLATCDVRTVTGFRDYVILLFLLDTGVRISEVCGLHITDVHDRYVKVFGKGRKEREIGMHPEMSKLLWKYIHKYRRPLDPSETALFIGRGRPLQTDGVHELIKRIQEKSGLSGMKFSAHVFRHTFAKMYLERGGDLFKLSRELGHSDVQVTRIYLEDFSSTDARKEHTAFSPIAGMKLQKKTSGQKKQK
jgi:integrase/recombinase XerD